MLLPSRQALAWLKGTQCITNCRYFLPLNPGRVKVLYSLPTPIVRCYATDRPVSRPKAHTGRTTSTRKPKAAAAPGTATTTVARTTTTTKAKPVAKKTGPGRPKSKTKAKPKTKTKTKTKAKTKAKPKPKKKVKKVLTEKQEATVAAKKKRSDIKALKEIALKPPKLKPYTAYQVVFAEHNHNRTAAVKTSNLATATSDAYKSLSTERREVSFRKLPSIFNTHQLNFRKALQSYCKPEQGREFNSVPPVDRITHPEVIRKANNARHLLRRRGEGRWTLLQDDRTVKSTRNGYIFFCSERRASGDFAGIRAADSTKRMAEEWKELSPEEKQVSQARSG